MKDQRERKQQDKIRQAQLEKQKLEQDLAEVRLKRQTEAKRQAEDFKKKIKQQKT